ncbi:helix-turn-helix domain-containing protein [Desulfonema limicola]|uniref:helix-turn-helix domain-containing protein n=1 Tax=Desulfonema limicola TaxID=45656 RepID=UPI001A9B53E7|nr:helix-turn-helix transcriptional regulator [Desulfonema limicola]
MKKSAYSPPQKALQKLLRQIRVDAGLRQNDLAELLDKPQSFVSKYESGERRLDLIELRYICRAIGTSLEEFVRKFENIVNSDE